MKQKIPKNSRFANYFYNQNKYNKVCKGYLEEKMYKLKCSIRNKYVTHELKRQFKYSKWHGDERGDMYESQPLYNQIYLRK